MKNLMKQIVPALRMLLFMSILLGVVYPLAVTLIGQTLFSAKVNGSLIERSGKIVGSSLISQKFEQPKYFHSRPSAGDYNPLPSGGTNLGPIAKKLQENVKANRAKEGETAPADLIFASGSGLDPHISPEAARFQIQRVAQARGFDSAKTEALERLVVSRIAARDLGFLGNETVNVLELNLAVDQM